MRELAKTIFKNPFKKILLRRNYYAMKGYRILKKENRLAELDLLKSQIIDSLNKFFQIDKSFKVDLIKDVDLQCGFLQYSIMTFCEKKLTYSLLYSVGSSRKVVLTVPPQVLNLYVSSGWNVNIFLSKILWFFNLIKYFLYGIYKFTATLWHSLFYGFIRNSGGGYAVFPDLNQDNLPDLNLTKSYDILTWFIDSYDDLAGVSKIYHPNMVNDFFYKGKSIVGRRDPLPYFTKVSEYFSFLYLSVSHIFFAIYHMLFGDWRRTILLSQVIDAIRAYALDEKKLGGHYLFNNNSAAYRPIWSYVLQARDIKIIFYFYSFNNESYTVDTKFSISHIWKNINWPYYLIWSSVQLSFFTRSIGFSPKYRIVGPITSISSAPPSNLVNQIRDERLKVAVFDIAPYRDSFYAGFALNHDYLTATSICKFLEHILTISNDNNALLYIKKKKNTKYAHKKYLHFYDTLAKFDNVVIVDAGVAAQELIDYCDVTISYPFTSTALMAKISGLESIYYDATSTISKDIPCRYDVELVSGLADLDLWFKKIRVKDVRK